MIQLTDEMREFINNARVNGTPCILSTASPDGVPNAGFRGSMMVLDDGALAYRERNQLSTWEHIQQNAKAVVLFRDAEKDVGWKFRCTVNVYQDGERFDQVMERLAELGYNVDPATPGTAVILQVDQVLNLTGEVLQERVPNLRW